MTTTQLATRIAHVRQLSQAQARDILATILTMLSEVLKAGEPVKLTGFGTFAVQRRPERIGRNPQTGEPLTLPAQTVAVFHMGLPLRTALNDPLAVPDFRTRRRVTQGKGNDP